MGKILWNINFSTLNVTDERANGWGTKYTHTDNLTNGVYKADGQGSTPTFALNAIDIDWNGAILDSTVISTTGDLLKYIKDNKSDLTIGNTSYTAAAGDHTHELTLQKSAYATSSIDLLDDTIYTLTAGGNSLAFKTPSGGATYTAGTNITIDSGTISHATPTAKTNIKGNKTTQLLATITTDSQGHVTDYDVISPAELWSLLQRYADDLYQPKPIEVTHISLDKSNVTVPIGRDVMITATIYPSNAANKNITWTSSNTSIATVTSPTTSGNAAIVTWQGGGEVTITATAEGDTSKTATCRVTCESLQPATTYYWYAGQTQPTSMSSNPTVDDTNFTNNKWHTLSGNQLSQTITGGTVGNSWYVAVPTTKGFKFYDSTLTEIDETATKLSTITVNSISYDIWKSNSTGAKTNVYMK